MSDAKEVLIVDDSEENVDFMAEILEDQGLPFRVARNGKEAMEALGEKRPDLVLLDVMMPRKSGLKVFQEMKRDSELDGIPIIIVTGLSGATGVDIDATAVAMRPIAVKPGPRTYFTPGILMTHLPFSVIIGAPYEHSRP